ncbi:MAG: hypothetical protein K2R98_09510 [Gemmataceae bacterium]|nr:hypothetical protein [Gemmataceae bacterium]
MIVRKITTGFVVQEFDSDTGRCLSQEFVAGDQVEWEDRQGNAVSDGDFGIDLAGLYFPLEMKQPEESDRGDAD